MNAAPPKTPSPADMQGLLMNRLMGEQSDPLVNAMLSAWMNRDANAGADSEHVETEVELRLRKTVRRLRSNLSATDDMLRYLSNVFGACNTCWGMHGECPRCHGGGHPGSAVPLRDPLLAWVTPALNRLGLRVVPEQGPARQAGSSRTKSKENANNVS